MLKTKVNLKFNRAYTPGMDLPKDQEKIMRREIKRMRENLIRKQEALERSSEFESDPQRMEELKSISLRKLKSPRQVWIRWQELRGYEESPNSSVQGKRKLRAQEIASMHMRGLTFINTKNYADFGHFMEYVRDNYDMHSLGSDIVVEYYSKHREMTLNDLERVFDSWISRA